jgi:hypothetical protein
MFAEQSATPIGYFFLPYEHATIAQFDVSGCPTHGAKLPDIEVLADAVSSDAPGSYSGSLFYSDVSSGFWVSKTPAKIDFSTAPVKPGAVVEGTFAGIVTLNGVDEMLAGKFRVCRVNEGTLP